LRQAAVYIPYRDYQLSHIASSDADVPEWLELMAPKFDEQAALLQEVFRAAALAELTKRVQGSLARANEAATADMDKLLEQQAELTRRQAEVSKGIESTQVRLKVTVGMTCTEESPIRSLCCIQASNQMVVPSGGETRAGSLRAGNVRQSSSFGEMAL
jgi:hypothetical protein